jgi:hypothetical protein
VYGRVGGSNVALIIILTPVKQIPFNRKKKTAKISIKLWDRSLVWNYIKFSEKSTVCHEFSEFSPSNNVAHIFLRAWLS